MAIDEDLKTQAELDREREEREGKEPGYEKWVDENVPVSIRQIIESYKIAYENTD